MDRQSGSSRRDFLQQAAAAGAVSKTNPPAEPKQPHAAAARRSAAISYPRQFEGPHLKMISFPLGGVAAGSIGLGGRGQLRDWEIFNKPDKGNGPAYALPSIWCQEEDQPPVTHVLEARYQPPYEGQDG